MEIKSLKIEPPTDVQFILFGGHMQLHLGLIFIPRMTHHLVYLPVIG